RVLYSMFDSGFRPDRGHVKCARVVGDVMGNYHPHGDSAIYDTLVRLAQPWSLRYPLIDGQGNFGSPGNDPAAAMRYCVTGDTRIRLDTGAVRIADLVPGAAPDSDHDLELKVRDRNGDVVRATRLFPPGPPPTRRLTTREGYQLTGTENHPVLCLVNLLGVPTLLWQLLGELRPGDHVVLPRAVPDELGVPPIEQVEAAILAGAAASDGVPEFVWRAVPAVRRAVLRALFEGDGSSSLLPRSTIQISYSTCSDQLARDVQQLLLEFGVISRLCRYADGEITVVVTNRRDALQFARQVGFLGRKQAKLEAELGAMPRHSRGRRSHPAPHVAGSIRAHGASRWTGRDWLRRHNLDRVERWDRDRAEIAARITNREVLEVVEPLVDGRFYYAEVATVEDAGVQPVYSIRVDTDDHAFISNGFVSHNTECRLSPLAMEMLREIDQDTVDLQPTYDGKSREPDILPSRIPNLLVNGGSGIAVGMATNIPPHNLREVAEGVYWALDNPEATDEELLAALLERIKGPDFPTARLIVGRDAIEEAYRTGRGSGRRGAVVPVEEDAKGRAILVTTELPYQVNPDNLAETVAALVKDGRVAGISDIADESSDRVGQRLVITLKRDAVPMVVLNNLYKHTQLQTTFGVNALALVDGVPRTLRLDQMVRLYVTHQMEVIVRRTRFRLRKAEERAHILRALLKALDQLDAVIALIRSSESADAARGGLMELLDIDEIQATAILDMQLRRLAAL